MPLQPVQVQVMAVNRRFYTCISCVFPPRHSTPRHPHPCPVQVRQVLSTLPNPDAIIEAVPELVEPQALTRALATIKSTLPGKDPLEVGEGWGGGLGLALPCRSQTFMQTLKLPPPNSMQSPHCVHSFFLDAGSCSCWSMGWLGLNRVVLSYRCRFN